MGINFIEGYQGCGQLEYIKNTIKWSTDYMIDANRLPEKFIGQIGNGDADHNYWGRPEDMNMNRPVMSVSPSKPGSDLAGESAAALASSSIFYKMIGEPALAAEALDNAKELYEFAEKYKGKYSDSIWDASKFYNSWSGYEDELAWGAAWLYKATQDSAYLAKAKQYFNSGNMCESNLWFGWDNKKAGVQVLMYDITGQDPAYKKCVDNFLGQLDSAQYTQRDSSLSTTGAQTGMPATMPCFALSLLRWATRMPNVTSLLTPKSDISLVTLEGATWSALARTLL